MSSGSVQTLDPARRWLVVAEEKEGSLSTYTVS
jgi:hypothetical protein